MKPKWPSRRQHAEHMSSDRRERTGNNSPKLKLDCGWNKTGLWDGVKLDCGGLKLDSGKLKLDCAKLGLDCAKLKLDREKLKLDCEN